MIGRPLANSFRFLKQKMLIPIKHYFYPKQFTFITLSQKHNLSFVSFPHEDWKVTKTELKQRQKIRLFGIFIIAFFIGDWLYSFKNNQNEMYFYYVNYPLVMKFIECSIADLQNFIDPFAKIIPKEKHEIPLVWQKLGDAIFKTEDKLKAKKQNVQKLKQQLQQIDKKLQ